MGRLTRRSMSSLSLERGFGCHGEWGIEAFGGVELILAGWFVCVVCEGGCQKWPSGTDPLARSSSVECLAQRNVFDWWFAVSSHAPNHLGLHTHTIAASFFYQRIIDIQCP